MPALNRCNKCGKPESAHDRIADAVDANHTFERDESRPIWHGWHAARRGVGTNLHRLGVPAETIRRILRHSNVATTQAHYILVNTADEREGLDKLEVEIAAKHAAALLKSNGAASQSSRPN